MTTIFAAPDAAGAIPIWFVAADTFPKLRDSLEMQGRAFAEAAGFEPKPGRHLLLPGGNGALAGVLFGIEAAAKAAKDLFLPGRLPGLLPAGTYRFANAPHDTRLAALAFALGAYRFTRYRKAENKDVRLALPAGVDARRSRAHRRGRHARARSRQHAGQRHGAGGTGGGGANARGAPRRNLLVDRRRRSPEARTSRSSTPSAVPPIGRRA